MILPSGFNRGDQAHLTEIAESLLLQKKGGITAENEKFLLVKKRVVLWRDCGLRYEKLLDRIRAEDSNWLTSGDCSRDWRYLLTSIWQQPIPRSHSTEEGIPMAELARKMPESAHVTAFSSSPGDLANEKHYSVIEISKLWALSQKNGTPDL